MEADVIGPFMSIVNMNRTTALMALRRFIAIANIIRPNKRFKPSGDWLAV